MEIPDTAGKELWGALVAAQAAAQAVGKDAKNTHHGYGYASAEAIITEAKAVLTAHGLAFFPATSQIVTVEGGQTLKTTWGLVHTGGQKTAFLTEWPIVPDKGRPADKALASARTSSLAYILRDLLLLPRVDPTDDMDHSSRDHSARKDQPPPAQGKSASQKAVIAQMRILRESLEGLRAPDDIRAMYEQWLPQAIDTGLSDSQTAKAKLYAEAKMAEMRSDTLTPEQVAIVTKVESI